MQGIRAALYALFFWMWLLLVPLLLLIPLAALLSSTLILEIVLATSGAARTCIPTTVQGLDALEDTIVSGRHCKSLWREFDVHVGGDAYRCRGHALLAAHRGHNNVPTILLLHGNAASALCFVELFDGLSESFNVLAIDIPGFGRSTSRRPPRGLAKRFFSNFVHNFLTILEIREVYIVAHSFGACIAADLAACSPGLVTHLLLLDAAGVLPTLGATGAYWAAFFKLSVLQWHKHLGCTGRWAFSNLFAACKCPPECYYWYAVTASSWGGSAVADCIYLAWDKAYWIDPCLPTLLALGIPIATGYGEHDNITPPHQGRALMDAFGWPTRVFAGQGHCPLHGCAAGELVRYIGSVLAMCTQPTVGHLSIVDCHSSFCTGETEERIQALYKSLLAYI